MRHPGLNLSDLNTGGVLFIGNSGNGNVLDDNVSFFWDDTNNRLAIGNLAPSQALHVAGGDLRFTDYPNTRNDGGTSNALYVNLTGQLQHGPVSVAGLTTDDFYEVYENGTTSIPVGNTALTTVGFDTVSHASIDFSLAAGVVTYTGTGITLAAVSYTASWDKSTGNTRTSIESGLYLNGAAVGNLVAGSYGYGYHRNPASGEDTATKTVLLELNTNDTLRVQSQRIGSNNGILITKSGGSNLVIETLVS